MELRQLQLLTAVVEKKGYVNAGGYLHVSHSAIHRQVRLLEEELGEKVFVKVGRAVQLTETGRLIVELAAKVKKQITDVEQQIKDKQDLVSGDLRIGTGTTALIFFLPPIIEIFRRKYPRVEMHIITGTADGLIRELQDGNVDLGIVSEPIDGWPAESNFTYKRLYTEEFSLAVTKKHQLAKRKRIDWSDLKDVPIISFPRTSRIRHLIDARFKAANVVPKVTMELENEEAIETMINISFGAGFIATRRIDHRRLRSVIVGDKPIILNIAAIYNSSYAPRRVREFLNILSSSPDPRTSST